MRDLLDPVPNAVAALKADDAHLAQENQQGNKLAQYFYHHHHHHHHHHHRWQIIGKPASASAR
jgi:hypothetical protein